ncbi:MAG: hypothetical protein K9L17_08135 [Clostridiales bacterium]|nr:hypothetical protein [Clostridiales bacterium]MCF8022643.1 hypothetical protein [Clostridiales bacterium]
MIRELKRVRLQTLARILSGRKLTLKFGKGSYTDLRTITLSPFDGEIEPGVPASKAECWVMLKASCAHESGHVLFTSRGVMEKTGDKLLSLLLNIIEDSRIELAMSNTYPGTAGWFKFSADYIIANRQDWGTGTNALLGGLTAYAVGGRVPDQIAAQKDVLELIENCIPIVDRGRIAEDTFGALDCAEQVYKELESYLKMSPPSKSPEVRGTYEPAKAPAQKVDPRRAAITSEEKESGAIAEETEKPSIEEEQAGESASKEVSGEPAENSEDKESIESPDSPDKDKSVPDPELIREAENELKDLEARSFREEKEELSSEETSGGELEEEISTGIHRGVFLRRENCFGSKAEYNSLYDKTRPYIKRTTNEIRKILEYKKSFVERNLRKGRLDTGSLWKIGAKNPKVFCRIDEPGDIPTLAVYLLVDCSGSMKGKSMFSARQAACLLTETCHALKIPVKVTGFTGAVVRPEGSDGMPRDVTHFEALNFDEDEKEKLAGLRASNENRDGYSIRVAAKELEKRAEDKKILIVLSDGLPMMPYKKYQKDRGINDTAKAVREAEKKGIGVIGLFFGTPMFLPNAQMIYNNCVYVDKIDTLPLQAARVFKKVISTL